MEMFRIKESCPVCGSDLIGNDKHRFLCMDCMLYFDRQHFVKGSSLFPR